LKLASLLLQCSVIPADDIGALNNQLLEISAVYTVPLNTEGIISKNLLVMLREHAFGPQILSCPTLGGKKEILTLEEALALVKSAPSPFA
jgi:hypothetical protein